MGMTSLTAGTPETAGHRPETPSHTRSTAVQEQAGLLQHTRHVPRYRGTQRAALTWLQEDKGTQQPLPPARHEALAKRLGQHKKCPKYKSNSKAGISPLPHTLQMKPVAFFLPPTSLGKVARARHSLTA